jgi:hypothetical protein
MAVKQASLLGTIASAVFGSILAPVLVNVANRELTGLADAANASSPSGRVRVVTSGRGRTAEEALGDARRNAVRIVAADVLGSSDAGTLRRLDGLVWDVEDLGGTVSGPKWEKEVAVTVAVGELARLRAGGRR